jgi:hypothetical protein
LLLCVDEPSDLLPAGVGTLASPMPTHSLRVGTANNTTTTIAQAQFEQQLEILPAKLEWSQHVVSHQLRELI